MESERDRGKEGEGEWERGRGEEMGTESKRERFEPCSILAVYEHIYGREGAAELTEIME